MTRAHCPFLYKNADTTCMRISWLVQSHLESEFKLVLWGPGSCERVFEDQDNWIAPEEHLWDEPVLVHRLCLLLPWVEIKLRRERCKRRWRNLNCKNHVKEVLINQEFTFSSFWQLCPHLLYPLKHHVAMPEEFQSKKPGRGSNHHLLTQISESSLSKIWVKKETKIVRIRNISHFVTNGH